MAEREPGRSRTGPRLVRNDSVSLDTPREARRQLLARPQVDPDAFGRASEKFARFMGTGTFLVYMTAFVVLWTLWNTLTPGAFRFDQYPFVFLTLVLSLQASYAAPLILLAQNRQDDRDRVLNEQDRSRDERGLADTEYLTREVAALRIALRDVATRDFVRSELRSILEELREEDGDPSASRGSRDAKRKNGKKRKRVAETPAPNPSPQVLDAQPAEPESADSGSEGEVPTPNG
ncbi:DUF1003 domain-containing protein [Kineococcus sp. GCM10028916]|uniref:DUF1003 domain-containing protein n=1 Tax=Kineococcus sp. GCM10028916 TaxID=3273394 RepID=UPI00362F6428